MKSAKLLFFPFAIFTTCYIGYYSVQRNTLAPAQPLSTLTIATTSIHKDQKGFTTDVINDLAHRMTQKLNIKTYSEERALHEVKTEKVHCAIISKQLAEQEKKLLVTPLKNDPSQKVLVVSSNNPDLFKRAHATLLEMTEDGALNDFAHKWNLS